MADSLKLPVIECAPTKFVTADGSPMTCSTQVQDLQWCAQGHSFQSTAGILPLKCFDMILGKDWLESCSPMWVHWAKKVMRFTHKGNRIELKGIQVLGNSCAPISGEALQGLVNKGAIQQWLQLKVGVTEQLELQTDQELCSINMTGSDPMLPEIQSLLDSYADIFQAPTSLPPQRPFDHHIQLLPGATPVNIRPYRYSPRQKDEIEKQLVEMLQNGIIKHSESPYASPVLLVRKKDGSWRFCIDYRHLNAQTVKNKHPMPIVEELIDELARARWFSKLDFRAGYHQI